MFLVTSAIAIERAPASLRKVQNAILNLSSVPSIVTLQHVAHGEWARMGQVCEHPRMAYNVVPGQRLYFWDTFYVIGFIT